ncbi:DNA polymerase III subunit gamma and tau [Arthrobacter burdickii]|uniref:DNA-directed DNA polymerase n=1 Tax=Arthrobacter burdickii TaxID=3035920 RepID=A0ABT8JVZ1_9MICC|nr:DNA polymerase III subunit gamma and tau [Arthrobacter burdickii]MDN4609338.1 DNA polymerase III subunit gamma and tau [Arthrobacter burdickii]
MSTALYRRYRPETFADVIGQEHVTEPLMAAIDKDRINHAYLFSGPRGCGKTTSARILARCLNCAQGPTSTPCGTCDSCVELARNGSGSLDVIEIDAASHGGVDDARDLRERATFAPVRDRFKIFIIDEAHMVTSAGFNALLKIVEEPPEHILFIFATTEPDKVIGTIRSRTHHYPFRLVPPEPLLAYLELLCHQENVPVAPGVLSLVIRAGGGSVRDSLSVLDQLMAGAGENGLDYELAVSLLGYTHATLLDDVVDSVAAGDAATVFNAVDRVIQTGHDPRRFVEDLLERFRDLIVINAVPEGAASILRGVPDDQLNRMRTQANQLGAGELSRAADVTNTALTEMTGATSPRLHLELLCARLLLPAADATARGTLARVDRIERRLEYAAGAPVAEVDDAPKAPARTRLDGVPRTAEEAAARWSLPVAEPAAEAPAVPAAVPGVPSPAAPAASRVQPSSGTPVRDSSPDWGGSWGVSTDSAFSDPVPSQPSQPTGQPSEQPAAAAPASLAGQAPPIANVPATERPQASPQESSRPGPTAPFGQQGPPPVQAATAPPSTPQQRQPAVQQPAAQGQQPGAPAAVRRPNQDDAPQQGPLQGGQPQPQPQHEVRRPDAAQQGRPAASGGNVEMVRRAWPEIMDEVARIKRATWLIVNVSAKPRSFEGNQLVLAFANQGNAIGFQRGPHVDNLKQAIHKVLGLTCSIEAVHDAGGAGESGPKVPASQTASGSTPGPDSSAPSALRGDSPTASTGSVQHPEGRGPAGQPGPAAAPGSDPGAQPGPQPSAQSDSQSGSQSGGSTVALGADAGRPGGPAVPATAGVRQPVGDPAVPATAGVRQPVGSPAGDTSASALPGSATPGPGRTLVVAGPPATVPDVQTPAGTPGSSGPGGQVPARTPGSSGPGGQAPVRTPGSPQQSRSGSHPAGISALTSAPSDGPSGGRRLQGSRPASPAVGKFRSAGGGPAASDPTTEAVSAWDPSMSDDSWALVEPPEEAFDPGPGWNAVPEDPYERRSPGTQGTAVPPAGGPAPDRAGGALPTASGTRRSGPQLTAPSTGVTAGPSVTPERAPERTPGPAHTPARTSAPQAPGPVGVPQVPEPEASRSVVWSPSIESVPPAPEAGTVPSPIGPTGQTIGFGGSGSPATPAGQGSTTGPRSGSPAPAGPGVLAPDRPASAENIRQKPVSRYQQLLDEAERKRAEEAAAARGTADRRFIEDEPSADDETIEESGLVGRRAIERILNGRLIEERSVDGQ